MFIKGCHTTNPEPPHHDQRNGVAEWERLVLVLPQQSDGRAVVGVGHFRKMQQWVLPEIPDDPLPHRLRAGEGRMGLREHEGSAQELGPLAEQGCDAVPCPGVMCLADVAKSDPERGIEEDPVAVHRRSALGSATTHCPRFLTYFLGAP